MGRGLLLDAQWSSWTRPIRRYASMAASPGLSTSMLASTPATIDVLDGMGLNIGGVAATTRSTADHVTEALYDQPVRMPFRLDTAWCCSSIMAAAACRWRTTMWPRSIEHADNCEAQRDSRCKTARSRRSFDMSDNRGRTSLAGRRRRHRGAAERSRAAVLRRIAGLELEVGARPVHRPGAGRSLEPERCRSGSSATDGCLDPALPFERHQLRSGARSRAR